MNYLSSNCFLVSLDRGLTRLPISGAPGKVSKRYTPFGSPPFINYWKNKQKETREITNSNEKQELYQRILLQMLDEMNQKDKKYMPFLNGHGQEEWQTENLEKSSVENQEKVLQRILEGKYSCNKITTTWIQISRQNVPPGFDITK